MWLQTRLLTAITLFASSVFSKPRTLDSVAPPTSLSLPLTQNLTGTCFTESQVFQGPTVDQWGRGIYYGPTEEVNKTTSNSAKPGSAVWGQPTIRLADGTTCCENLADVSGFAIDDHLISPAYLF